MHDHETRLTALGVARWRIAGGLTAVMLILFGFIFTIAYHGPPRERRNARTEVTPALLFQTPATQAPSPPIDTVTGD